jgi:hypothetical protein
LEPDKDDIKELLNDAEASFKKFIESGNAVGDPPPYSVRVTTEDGVKRYTLHLPRNIKDNMSANSAVVCLLYFAKILNYDCKFVSGDFNVTKGDKLTNLFWKSFSKELMADRPPESLTFRKGSAGIEGASAARLLKLKSYLSRKKVTHLYTFVSPAVFTNVGNREVEILTVYTDKLAVVSKDIYSGYLGSTLRTLASQLAEKKTTVQWTVSFDQFKVPTSEAIKDLHRKKTTKVKGKEIISTKTPNRPSQRAETVLESERFLLSTYLEKSFDEYKDIMTDATTDKGVELVDLQTWRTRMSSVIADNWKVVDKCSAYLTHRGKLLSELVSKKKVGNKMPSKENYLTLLRELRSFIDDRAEEAKILNNCKFFRSINLIDESSSEDKSSANSLEFRVLGGQVSLTGLLTSGTTVIADEILVLCLNDRAPRLPTPQYFQGYAQEAGEDVTNKPSEVQTPQVDELG